MLEVYYFDAEKSTEIAHMNFAPPLSGKSEELGVRGEEKKPR